MRYADVIVPVPLDDSYTYIVPDEMVNDIVVGCRVQVGFGRSKTYVGIVVRLHDETPVGFDLKPILKLIDHTPVVNSRQLDFWRWISQYYICPLGDVYNAALPAKMKKTVGESKRKRKNDVSDGSDMQLSLTSSSLSTELSSAQQKAYDEICESFESKDITLLHGVTSSGKTEIYIHIINKYINEGKQVLYLLPEIALTTQITERLQRVFGDNMGVYHSMFTDAQRSKVYLRQLSDNPYKLILGVRSSVFMPFQNLGLVIVDEEHETSYKQQDPAPRYHARSAAIMLARMFGAKTLLGTATPSVETYNLALSGRYGYVNMTQRYGDVSMPSIEVVDIARLRFQHRMKGAFSPLLLDAIGDALNNGGQVILFHNRRGYSNLLECKSCGWIPRCSHCDVSLTYHMSKSKSQSADGEKKEPASRGFLVCHYCGKVYNIPDKCPNCESTVFSRKGNGTERIEDQISNYFPTARVLRMDTDTAHTRTAYEQIISDFSAHKYDILVGTQMVSKGLDFGGVTVVGILDADVMLNQPDFRSYERSFHMLTQVAGRAGRKEGVGRVILQTRSKDCDIISHVVSSDYRSMYDEQIEERKLFRYPPFYRLIYIYMKHPDSVRLDMAANDMQRLLVGAFGVKRVLGPDRPPVARIHSMYIRKFILKIEPSFAYHEVRLQLQQIRQQIVSSSVMSGLTIYYDVDPM